MRRVMFVAIAVAAVALFVAIGAHAAIDPPVPSFPHIPQPHPLSAASAADANANAAATDVVAGVAAAPAPAPASPASIRYPDPTFPPSMGLNAATTPYWRYVTAAFGARRFEYTVRSCMYHAQSDLCSNGAYYIPQPEADAAACTANPVVFVSRGGCSFYRKAVNAQQSGAAALVIVNDDVDFPAFEMASDHSSSFLVTIPVVMITKQTERAMIDDKQLTGIEQYTQRRGKIIPIPVRLDAFGESMVPSPVPVPIPAPVPMPKPASGDGYNGADLDSHIQSPWIYKTAAFGARSGYDVTGCMYIAQTDLCQSGHIVPPTNNAKCANMQPIVFVKRGSCTFYTKAVNAQLAGAGALVVVNTDPTSPTITMGSDGSSSFIVTIPVVMISRQTGEYVFRKFTSAFGLNAQQTGVIQPITVRLDESGDMDKLPARPLPTSTGSSSVPFPVPFPFPGGMTGMTGAADRNGGGGGGGGDHGRHGRGSWSGHNHDHRRPHDHDRDDENANAQPFPDDGMYPSYRPHHHNTDDNMYGTHLKKPAFIGVCVAVGVVSLALLMVICYCCCRKYPRDHVTSGRSLPGNVPILIPSTPRSINATAPATPAAAPSAPTIVPPPASMAVHRGEQLEGLETTVTSTPSNVRWYQRFYRSSSRSPLSSSSRGSSVMMIATPAHVPLMSESSFV